MKKYLYLFATIIAVSSLSIGSVNAFQQQGFSQYKENGKTVSFSCDSSCAILLGDKWDNDTIIVKWWSHQWSGQRGYGYVLWQNVYAATIVPVRSYEWSFSDDPIYKQLPAGEKKVVFLVSGPLKADDVTISMQEKSFGENISWSWSRFWNIEKLAPYSINLHYGPMIGWWSWPLFWLIIAIISLVIWAIITQKLSVKKIVRMISIILITLMIIGGIRLLIDNIRITNSGIDAFAGENKIFFDLWNYIPVTEKIREALHLEDRAIWKEKKCTIYAKTNMDWPFVAHRWAVYLRPCEMVQTGSLADYQLFYNSIPTITTGTIILTGDDFALFANPTH